MTVDKLMNISKLQFPPQTWIDYIVARIKDDITAYMEKESKRVDICVYIYVYEDICVCVCTHVYIYKLTHLSILQKPIVNPIKLKKKN